MKTRDVLKVLKEKLEEIQPPIGNIFAVLRKSPKPEDVIQDYKFKDPVLGDVIKAFILRPGDSRISRATTGNVGFSIRVRNIIIDGFISVRDDSDQAEDVVLEDAWDAIVDKLQKVSRLEDKSQGDAFHVGEMTLGELAAGRVSNKKVLSQRLTTVVQDRIP